MKERPILFSGEMVRAILDGRKTQSRRIMKNPPAYPGTAKFVFELHPFAPSGFKDTPAEGIKIAPEKKVWVYEDWCGNVVGVQGDCPYGQPGDRLWVRETWREPEDHEGYESGVVLYAASEMDAGAKWKPSIHMKRNDARILLEIVSVRVERLQDISEEGAKAEGVLPVSEVRGVSEPSRARVVYRYKHGFLKLWESINGPGSWEANPWVWVIEFKWLKP